MRGLATNLSTSAEINNMAMKGAGTQGTWKSIEMTAKNYKMKYNINNRISKYWDWTPRQIVVKYKTKNI